MGKGTTDRKKKNSVTSGSATFFDLGRAPLEPHALAELYARIDRNNADMMLLPKPTRSTSIDTVRV
jgi:hypothetical protein